jgi:hypothetical protein
MKTRIVLGVLMASALALQVAAQVENDDMYFKAKDREKLRAENAAASFNVNDKIDNDYKAFKKKHFEETEEITENVNPTDSYSARTVNPEYISRSNSEQAGEDEQNYYVEGYTPPTTYDSYSGRGYSNNALSNNWNNTNWNYRNSWYGNSFYDPFYSPYYGFRDPWMSPYYCGGSGLSMSLGYTWGNSWGPGWNYGMGYGWGGNPYGYYSPYSNWGYSNWGYPTYYNNGGYENNSGVTYGKRPSRHSAVVTPTQRSHQRVTNNGNTNGRVRQTSDEYYVKPMRRTATSDNAYRQSTSTDYSRTRGSYNSNSRESSRPSYSTPSRSSSYSTPSRSSSGGGSAPSRSSGGSSGSRSRGN